MKMRRFLSGCLALFLCCTLCTSAMALALADYVAQHAAKEYARIGETVKAMEDGYCHILFSDGYHGFCADYGKREAKKGDEFTVFPTSIVDNNRSGEDVSQYLKVLFVDYFNTFFTINVKDGQKVVEMNREGADKIVMQHTIRHFTDGFTGWRVDPDTVADVKSKVENGKTIPDHGYYVMLPGSETECLIFDFEGLKVSGEREESLASYQDFFAYQITVANVNDLHLAGGDPGAGDLGGQGAPGTGDEAPLVLWVVLLTGSVAGMMVLGNRKQKRA